MGTAPSKRTKLLIFLHARRNHLAKVVRRRSAARLSMTLKVGISEYRQVSTAGPGGHLPTRLENDFQASAETLYRPAWVMALASDALSSTVPELDAIMVKNDDMKKFMGDLVCQRCRISISRVYSEAVRILSAFMIKGRLDERWARRLSRCCVGSVIFPAILSASQHRQHASSIVFSWPSQLSPLHQRLDLLQATMCFMLYHEQSTMFIGSSVSPQVITIVSFHNRFGLARRHYLTVVSTYLVTLTRGQTH